MNKMTRVLAALILLGVGGINFVAPRLTMAESTDAEGAAAAVKEGRANIKVKGMHCEECNSAIVGQVKKVTGVRSVVADFKSGTAKVTFDAGTSMQEISKAIEKAGYEVLEISPG